nr:hypothetical protein [uncultured bacterium]
MQKARCYGSSDMVDGPMISRRLELRPKEKGCMNLIHPSNISIS